VCTLLWVHPLDGNTLLGTLLAPKGRCTLVVVYLAWDGTSQRVHLSASGTLLGVTVACMAQLPEGDALLGMHPVCSAPYLG